MKNIFNKMICTKNMVKIEKKATVYLYPEVFANFKEAPFMLHVEYDTFSFIEFLVFIYSQFLRLTFFRDFT